MEEKFSQIMNAAQGWDGDVIQRVLGALVILGAVAEKFAIAELIDAEADKINALVDAFPEYPETPPTVQDLIDANNSVGNVFAQLCCVLNAINEQVERGADLLQD